MPSPHDIARTFCGSVRTDRTGLHAVVPGPGQKPTDRSLSIWVEGDDFRVYSHRGDDWLTLKDYVRRGLGLPAWQPKRRAPLDPARTSHAWMTYAEGLRVGRSRRAMTFEQFQLLISDLRNAGGGRERARELAREFRFTDTELDRAMSTELRRYKADERAGIWSIKYSERQALRLRRTGSVDLDKGGRERARRDRYNAKRRAQRAAARATGRTPETEGGVNRYQVQRGWVLVTRGKDTFEVRQPAISTPEGLRVAEIEACYAECRRNDVARASVRPEGSNGECTRARSRSGRASAGDTRPLGSSERVDRATNPAPPSRTREALPATVGFQSGGLRSPNMAACRPAGVPDTPVNADGVYQQPEHGAVFALPLSPESVSTASCRGLGGGAVVVGSRCSRFFDGCADASSDLS